MAAPIVDVIRIDGIRVYGKHGANPGERDRAQAFDVTVRLEADLSLPQNDDELKNTIDYAHLHAQIVHVVQSASFSLLERLAGEILQAIFSDSRVARAEVTVAKPGLLNGATPSVTIQRDNPIFRK